jgi:uncharacterized protein YndB with AHSA1/START domain
MKSNRESNSAGASPSLIRVEYEFAEEAAVVWRALTEPALLAKWLMPNDIRPVPGHRFTFRGEPTPEWDGIVYCEILDVETNKRLVYTWRNSPPDSALELHGLDTIVSWTLIARDDGGTTLLLEHSGFEPDSFVLRAMGNGWTGKLRVRLRDVISRMND